MRKKFISRISEGGSIEASYLGYKFYAWSYWYISFSFGRRDYRIGTFGGKHFQYLKREAKSAFPDKAEAMEFPIKYQNGDWLKEHEKTCPLCNPNTTFIKS